MAAQGSTARLVTALRNALRPFASEPVVLAGSATREYVADFTRSRGITGYADAVVLPASVDEAVAAVEWCYAHGVAIVPRGGGTGYAGGAVPHGGVVIAMQRLSGVRSFTPESWRIELNSGTTTAALRHLVRAHGLFFPPDPGATEQSQVGGNLATNAGGPHAFKYGVTRAWVTGVEIVVAPGELLRLGGSTRKNASGYSLTDLVVGSEGTLGLITGATLRLIPAPETALALVAFYPDAVAGVRAIREVVANGVAVAALEYFDQETTRAASRSFPGGVPADDCFVVIAEADGSTSEAVATRRDALDALQSGSIDVRAIDVGRAASELWRWREGVSFAVTALLGAKAGEDVAVPFEHIEEALEALGEIAVKHRLSACSWGHAGDGNLHANFLFEPADEPAMSRVEAAQSELFEAVIRLGGAFRGAWNRNDEGPRLRQAQRASGARAHARGQAGLRSGGAVQSRQGPRQRRRRGLQLSSRRAYDVAVVGAGLVGLSTARAVLLRRPDARVIVFDKETTVARHQSSHNSGVIHAGLYYEPGSLKAELCRAGRAALLEFADERGIPYRLPGKLVVASDESELGRLSELRRRAAANGLQGVRELAASEIGEVEPHVRGVRALLVPETGVIDYAEVARAYAGDVAANGGELALGNEVIAIEHKGRLRLVRARGGAMVEAAAVVICAGLQSDRLARLVAPGRRDYRIVPFRGDFFKLSRQAAGMVRGLVYPVPDPAFPFLGVHFTRRLDGEVWAGPNAVPAFAREHYGRMGFDLRDTLEVIGFAGTWRLGRRYYRTGAAEVIRDLVKRTAVRDMRRYLPGLEMHDVHHGPCGIRAQLLGRDGRLVDDFVLEESENVLAVVNAPSPAATASLAIAERLADSLP